MKLVLVMAATADGMIARNAFDSVDWTGKADKEYFARITRKAGVVIMGSKTFDTLLEPLPGRLNIVMTRNKNRKSENPQLIFTDQLPEQILQDLEGKGFAFAALIGGAKTNHAFMEKGLIDEIHLTMVPRFFGKGISLFSESLDKQLQLQSVEQIQPGHLLMIFRVLSEKISSPAFQPSPIEEKSPHIRS